MSFGEATLHHGLLALTLVALGGAGLRLASTAAARGLVRAIAALVAAASAAVLEALALGLVGLGTDPLALTLAALATWGAARAWLPPPAVSPAGELIAWARGLGTGGLALAGAVGGAIGAWSLWLLLYPALGHDMLLYHVPEAVSWVHNGSPGSIERVVVSLPVGNYPLTHEVLLAWGLGIGRSFVWATAVTAAMPPLIAAAAWAGLRDLRVGRLPAALAAAALVTTPAVLASQSGGASLDPAALAWLLSTATLCLKARERPALLPFAVLAAGLAVGTKTTAAPLAVVVLILGLVGTRGRLRPIAPALAAAAVGAVLVGGIWYARNLVDHGSPLWPFVDAPWGDPSPPVIEQADISFLDRPGDTLSQLDGYYVDHFGGPLLLLAAALLAPLAARTRAVAGAAAAALGSVLIWLNAPFTGVVDHPAFALGTGDATRYLLPGVAAAALAVALASRRSGWVRVAATGALAAAAAIGLGNTFDLGFPNAPSPTTPLAGAAAGALAALGATQVLRRVRVPPIPGWAAVALAVAAAAPLGALAADGYVERHARTGTPQSPLAEWFTDQPSWRKGDAPVASTFSLIAPLAGDGLRHPLELVGLHEPCDRVAERRLRGWIVLDRPSARFDRAARCLDGVPPGHLDPKYSAYPPAGGVPPASPP